MPGIAAQSCRQTKRQHGTRTPPPKTEVAVDERPDGSQPKRLGRRLHYATRTPAVSE